MDAHFLVKILEVSPDTILVTFPGSDYPVEDMQVQLEFHDSNGYDRYRTRVLRGPRADEEGVILARPQESERMQHRDSCRIPTDLTVQIKDQIHVRKYDAALINLSAGGALIRTDADFAMDTTVEVRISLPGEAPCTLLGQVVHTTSLEQKDGLTALYGIRFVSVDPEIAQVLSRYVWKRIKEVHPSG